MRLTLSLVLFLMSVSGAAKAGSYYDQFVFQTIGSCSDINSVWFHNAATFKDAELGVDDKNREVRATATISFSVMDLTGQNTASL